jgi:hypothetical protein
MSFYGVRATPDPFVRSFMSGPAGSNQALVGSHKNMQKYAAICKFDAAK